MFLKQFLRIDTEYLSLCDLRRVTRFFLPAIFLIPLLAKAATVSLSPVADTALFQNSPNNNLGSETDFPAGSTGRGSRSRGLIRFDITGQIPADATVTSSTLTLKVVKTPSGAVSSTFGVHRLLKAWTEGTKSGNTGQSATANETTWNNRLAPSTPWSVPGASAPTDYSSTESAALSIAGIGSYTFSSTSAMVSDVQFWLDNSESNFGWILISQSESTSRTAKRFGAREVSSNAASLVVAFTSSSIPTYPVTLGKLGEGSISIDPLKERYESEEVVTVTAASATGWGFAGWSGGMTDSRDSFSFSVTEAIDLVATFKPIRQLSVIVDGEGSVATSSAPPYLEGTSVALTATPATGWGFAEWTSDIAITQNPISTTLDTDKTITAVFKPVLIVNVQGTGEVTKTPSKVIYNLGETVTLKATPGRYYEFSQWSDAVSDNPRSITIGSDNSFTSVFESSLPLETRVIKQWDKSFGGSGNDTLLSMQQTSDQGFLLGGYSDSGTGGNKTNPSFGLSDYWIVKTDANGTKEWDKSFGGDASDLLLSVLSTDDGGYFLGGESASGTSGNKSSAGFGNFDYWVIKTNQAGDKQWEKTFGGENADELKSVQQTVDGGFILGGRSGSGVSGNKTASEFGGGDFWVIKTDKNGAIEWDKSFGGDSVEFFSSLQQTADGGFIL